MLIIPSILTDSPTEFKQLLSKCENVVERVHIDVIDGVYADNLTVTPEVLSHIDTNLSVDFHLMVSEPNDWIGKCAAAGASRIICQIESIDDVSSYIEEVSSVGVLPGIAIDVDTAIEKVSVDVISGVDVVVVMSVPAGFGGQKFHPKVLEKIKYLYDFRTQNSLDFSICDDGGITLEWMDELALGHVDEICIGRRIFDGSLSENVSRYLDVAAFYKGGLTE